MSNAMYDEIWRSTQNLLEETVQLDSMVQQTKVPRERAEVRGQLAELYVRYIDIGNKIEECYDQIVQPQKRPLLKRILDSLIGRVLELKHELVEVELSEYNYCDDALLSRKLTPDEIELRVPRYFRREREQEILSRRKFIEETLRNLGELEEKPECKKMAELEAIRLIQAHERARQGRVRFQFMKEILETKERSTIRAEARAPDATTGIAAALEIQKVWRGYTTRRGIRQRKLDEMLLIGMLQPSQTISNNARKLEKIEKERYEKQKEFQEVYDAYTVEAKERIRLEKSALMEENIRIEIRNWINTYYKQTCKIPELPSAESGGSRIIFSRQDTESRLSNSTNRSSSKESKRSKKSSKGKKDSEAEPTSDAESEPGFKPVPSNFLPELIQANQEYQDVWRDKDESRNLEQGPYLDMVDVEKSREVEDEVRVDVDQALRADIEALQAALDRDKGTKGKRAKKAPKRVRRSGKKNKRKKEKDLTPDRTTESLFEELLQQGIIKLYPEVRIDSFNGQKSYANFDLRAKGSDPLPAIGDTRQIVKEYCILPLGSEALREMTPLVRSVLIAGPRGSGKRMLVHAICTELGATLFDITPANVAGKYPGKSGLIMLLHLISKVSRLLQPSVIFMDGAEKPFVKKVPKTDKTDPKRLKKDLPKFIKSITNEDRVILIGTSRSPWEGDQKLIYQTYDKVIFIPRPDYGSMSLVWKNLLYKYSGISRQFDTSGMAKICDGFTIGTVLQTINEVMTTKRMVQLRVQPLTHIELINALSSKDPVYREEEDAFLNWYSKTPTCKKKQRVIEMELAKMEEANEKRKKGKGKKK
ncbi:dynein regulatory complex protein 11 isoform X2 [Phymastichus coffea]|uniref:dynein regulatory complex protein 11 isoform X2 n=1 Tax=Phymastichus coffea TaxID=108790 RepID=UPI00273CE323|nr:dynein regulatory complex protein 11 isoform X2 [Phymastichus coffea]